MELITENFWNIDLKQLSAINYQLVGKIAGRGTRIINKKYEGEGTRIIGKVYGVKKLGLLVKSTDLVQKLQEARAKESKYYIFRSCFPNRDLIP